MEYRGFALSDAKVSFVPCRAGYPCVTPGGVACFQSDRFVLYETQPALQVDSLLTSRPLSPRAEDVQTPADITQQFDQITYSKVLS